VNILGLGARRIMREKKLLYILIAITIIFVCGPNVAINAEEYGTNIVNLRIDGKEINDVQAYLWNGKVMIPARYFFEEIMGRTVSWDNDTSTVIVGCKPLSGAPKPSDYLPGDVYREYIYATSDNSEIFSLKVIGIEKNNVYILYTAKKGNKITEKYILCMSATEDAVIWDKFESDDTMIILSMPFVVGNKWKFNEGSSVKIKEILDLETPLGKFSNTIKLEIEGDKQIVLYMAPGVGILKGIDDKGKEIELTEIK